MTGRKTRDEIESRLDDVRRLLREHHAGIEPDARFADHVMARLPRVEGWTIAWAARRILPVSIAFAAVLMIAALATVRSTDRTTPSALASAASQNGNDSLEWLLEGSEERR